VAPTSCVAVGSYIAERPGSWRTLVESWDGRSWSIVPSPNTQVVSGDSFPAPSSRLDAVSCTTRRSCVAVGEYFFYPVDSGHPHGCQYGLGLTFSEVWDGTTWTIIPSPNPAHGFCDAEIALDGVSCPGSDSGRDHSEPHRRSSCVAVGYTRDEELGTSLTVTETWDGHSWTLVPSPSPGLANYTGHLALTGVSCTTTTSCVAAGYVYPGNGTSTTLVEAWDGHAWTIVPSPNPSTFRRPLNVLSGVSCATARSCSAVGWYGATDNGSGQTLVETWNGTTWNARPSPSRGTFSFLNAVSCPTPASCVAVGENGTDTFRQTLALFGAP